MKSKTSVYSKNYGEMVSNVEKLNYKSDFKYKLILNKC